tara:strand:+ start:37822 stop:38241 length:420 start_codon:yes stop_codon:yes gene_type:complete
MKGQYWVCNSVHTREKFLEHARQLMIDNPYVLFEWVYGNARTGQQNKAVHVFFDLVAEALNERGITFTEFFRDGFEVKWSSAIVKQEIWRPVQKAVIGFETSTSKCKTTDYPNIYEPINKKLSEFGIHVPWPEEKEKKM